MQKLEMAKLLLLTLLVMVFKCNGQLPGIDDFIPVAQKQVKGVLGIASSILGGITSGIGLNFGGQLGLDAQKHPEHGNNNQYTERPQSNPEMIYTVGGNQPNENSYRPPNPPPHGQRPYQHPPSPPYNDHRHPPPPYNDHRHPPPPPYNEHQYPPHHGRPGGYGSGHEYHGQYYGSPNQYSNEHYNNYPNHYNNGPARPGYNHQHEGNFNNNGYYGNNPNQYHQTGQKHPTEVPSIDLSSESYNTPGYDNQEYLNNIKEIFGNNPNHPDNGPNSGTPNSGTQNPNKPGFTLGIEKTTNTPKENLPTFGPLTPIDTKKDTDSVKPSPEEEFNIDIRVKDK